MVTRMDRRSFLGLTAAAAAGLALPGCGGGSGAPSGLSGEDRQLFDAASARLEFWNPATNPLGQRIIGSLVQDFNRTIGKQHRIFATSRVKPVGNAGYVQYTTAMSSSGSPDVVMTYEYTPVAGWAANGFIRPLDPYASGLGISERDFYPVAWQMIQFDGHIWGLLQEFDMSQLFFNRALFSGTPPKAVEEMDALSRELTRVDSGGRLTQVGLVPWDNNNGNSDNGQGWNWMFGGSFYDHANRRWTIDRPENRAFLEWFLRYVELVGGREKSDALVSSANRNLTNTDILTEGKAVFEMEGEWVLSDWKDMKLPLDYGVAHPPVGPGVQYGTGVIIGGNVFVLPTKAPHPEEAALFIQHMGSQAGARGWCQPTGNLPPVRAVGESSEFLQAWPGITPWMETLGSFPVQPPTGSPQLQLFNQTMQTAIDEVTYKKKTPAAALAEVDGKIGAAVKQFRQEHPKWPGE